MSEREILNIVRDALSDYYVKRNGPKVSTMAMLEQEAIDTMRAMLSIVDSMPRQERIWLTNQIDTIVESGKPMDGATFNTERFVEVRELSKSFKKYLQTPISINGLMITPIVILSRESNPPTNWGMPIEEPEQIQVYTALQPENNKPESTMEQNMIP